MMNAFMAQLMDAQKTQYEECAYALQQYKVLRATYARLHGRRRLVPPTELPKLLEALILSATDAVGRKAVHPWLDVTAAAYVTLHLLERPLPTTGINGVNRDVNISNDAPPLRNVILLAGHEFIIDCGRLAYCGFDSYQDILHMRVEQLIAIEKEAETTIRIGIKRNDVLDDYVALRRAQFVVMDNAGDYSVVDIGATGQGRTARVDICGPPRQVGKVDFRTALAACDADLISSICTAPGAENFPLIETSVPVLIRKYTHVLGLPPIEEHDPVKGARTF